MIFSSMIHACTRSVTLFSSYLEVYSSHIQKNTSLMVCIKKHISLLSPIHRCGAQYIDFRWRRILWPICFSSSDRWCHLACKRSGWSFGWLATRASLNWYWSEQGLNVESFSNRHPEGKMHRNALVVTFQRERIFFSQDGSRRLPDVTKLCNRVKE